MKIKSTKQYRKSYGKLAVITIAAVYLLILVGGIVRSSGSGMGCPDWPRCFGQWVPPTDVAELPANYQEVYLEKRLAKNERLATVLDRLGMENTAAALRTEEVILEESDFNAVNTWIEYGNRLVGVAIGLLIIATFIRSLKFWHQERIITLLSGFALLLVIFQGWLGAIVVSTNLLPWMVTLHMLPALLLVAILELAAFKANPRPIAHAVQATKIQVALWLAMALTLVQIILGTQVREAIDVVAAAFSYQNREAWVAQLDGLYFIHRSFSWVLLMAHLYLLYLCSKPFHRELRQWAVVLLVILLIEAGIGIYLAYFGFPAVLQPLHLMLGTLLFGLQFYMILLVRSSRIIQRDLKLQTC
ncbi:MAG: COX15/CtaA family protein [Bacteroidetes bacterium]|nr:COX15/CtaA family protein [Bacteroidota bacterium]